MTKLEKFMSRTEPKKSTTKLITALDDILVLKEQGYTLEQVQVYLKDEFKINTSLSNLSSFLKRQTFVNQVTKNDVKEEVAKPQISTDLSEEEQEKARINDELGKAFAKFVK